MVRPEIIAVVEEFVVAAKRLQDEALLNLYSIRYPVTGEPPSLVGAFHNARSEVASFLTMERLFGAPAVVDGTSDVTKTGP